MRVLLLHASLGSGHVSAARAIAAELDERGAETRNEDALAFTNQAMRGLITTIISGFAEEAPSLYRMLYEGTDSPDPDKALRENELYGKLQAPMYKDLAGLIAEFKPDHIVCAQQLPALVVHALNESGAIDIPWSIVVTDYMAHSSWIMSNVGTYFVATPSVASMLEAWGIPDETVVVSGIPIGRAIRTTKKRETMRTRHGLPTGPSVLAIASGVDTTRFVTMVNATLDAMAEGTVTVVAGRNEEVREALEGQVIPSGGTLDVRGFIDYLDDLVVAADVVVTKPGGLITTEVLARGRPMIAVDPFPGQEEWNADYVTSIGGGIQLRVPAMVGEAVAQLLSETERRERMAAAALAAALPDAASTIADHILR